VGRRRNEAGDPVAPSVALCRAFNRSHEPYDFKHRAIPDDARSSGSAVTAGRIGNLRAAWTRLSQSVSLWLKSRPVPAPPESRLPSEFPLALVRHRYRKASFPLPIGLLPAILVVLFQVDVVPGLAVLGIYLLEAVDQSQAKGEHHHVDAGAHNGR